MVAGHGVQDDASARSGTQRYAPVEQRLLCQKLCRNVTCVTSWVRVDYPNGGTAPSRVASDSMSRLERITTDPEVCHGQPTVRGLRYPVEMLLELLASGMTTDQILADYADLEADDVYAALEYGALTAGARQVIPLRAG